MLSIAAFTKKKKKTVFPKKVHDPQSLRYLPSDYLQKEFADSWVEKGKENAEECSSEGKEGKVRCRKNELGTER